MKHGMVPLFCAIAISGLVGCSKSSDGNSDGGGGSPSVQKVSVIGQASKVGVFPDGTAAQPLSDQQMAELGKVTQGAMTVNQAISKVVPPASLQRSGDVAVEAGQAVLKSGVIQKLLSLRASTRDADQFEQDLRNCTPSHRKSQPQESGSDTEKDIGWQEGASISGAGCPVDSNMSMVYRIHMWRLGEQSAKAKMTVDMSYNVQMQNTADQLQFDFVGQSLSGRIEGEMLMLDQSQEMALNGRFQGQLKTNTQGQIDAQVLFDLYSLQKGSQKSTSISAEGSLQLAAALIVKTNAGNVLLQVFASGSGQQGKVLVYLNGKEIKVDGAGGSL